MFSIIICTYNPHHDIFARLLNSISNFDKLSPDYEIIIVDNNSKPPIGSFDYIHEFIVNHVNCKLIIEGKPGLTNARIAGINQAKAEWLIFFDDDNEPDEQYLEVCSSIIFQHPEVCAWGPGVVTVEFFKKNIPKWFKANKQFYQDSFIDSIFFDNKVEWSSCYPNGTGLVIRKNVATFYTELFEQRILTLADRIGKSLVSGGDTQMVMCGIKLGYFAGVSPKLKLNHLISGNKINLTYLLKQSYLTASCYVKAFNELNFDNNQIPIILEGNLRILTIIYYTCRTHLFRVSGNEFLLVLYDRIGEVNARYYACNSSFKPILLRLFEKLINV